MRPSSEILAEKDALDRKRRALDLQIEERRKQLAELNAQVPALEREYQSAVALEQQAALAKTDVKH